MCGIGGIFDAKLSTDELHAALARMERALVHRGPDEGGTLAIPAVRGGLCVRRLSIVDLENGSQPMANEDGGVFALLNGEIYNWRELRQKLLVRGHRFRGHSDTEVVAHLYEEFGEDCFAELHGMFAIAICDTVRRRLLLARDGPGMKHLYFAHTSSGFLFASEARAMFASGMVDPAPNPRGIGIYLSLSWIPAPLSAFRGLERLKAGQFLRIDETGVHDRMFWKCRYQRPAREISGEEYSEELERLLTNAVRSHLAADVPVGACLSGGWDSSLTTALAAEIAGRTLKTFSLTFPDDPAIDESRFSRLMANHLGTDHHEIEFRAAAMPELLPRIARHMDEPCGNVPAAALFVLSSLASAHVKTVLSGEGADELFAGYEHFLVNAPYWLRSFAPRSLARAASHRVHDVRLRRGLRFLAAPDVRFADAEWHRLFTPRDQRAMLRPDLWTDDADLESAVIDRETADNCADRLQRRLSFEFGGRLGNAVLLTSDRMFMAHSVEARMPFLDRTIVDFALRLPSRLKAHRGREKLILAPLARKRLPPDIAARHKRGLAYPRELWSRPPCDEYVREALLDSRDDGPFDRDWIEACVGRMMTPARGAVLRLLVLQLWWNEFMCGAQFLEAAAH